MKKKLLLLALLASGGLFAAIGIGITIGPPPPPPVAVAPPPLPGPGYTWINGYWYPVNGRYVWHQGYWTRPPYAGARWIGPRHDGGRYYDGYWDGDHGRREHDHHWDRDHDRDYHH
ncbi:MAG TPA: hypothetical protein VK789_12205 [Bryobacteraceae bacterium]|jgi:hypothetical protein|nr:hypothetical protein [Bryobacteraceae bacterium]